MNEKRFEELIDACETPAQLRKVEALLARWQALLDRTNRAIEATDDPQSLGYLIRSL